MSNPTFARYRTTHWSSDTPSLCKRDSLLTWLDKEMIRPPPHDGRRGRPVVFTVAANQS